MRVISGTARGKKLISLEGLETRPTLDRVKESIFNIIQFDIKNSNVLDLFSGSGALAIEALSRGAKNAVLCDNSKKAVQIINKNLEGTRLKDNSEVFCIDYLELLDSLKKQKRKFDIIFLDPPYKSNCIEKSIKKIIEYNLIENDGIIIAETDDEDKIKNIKDIDICDTRKYGIVHVIFIRKG